MSLKKRKYSETYLKFGFTFTINNGLNIPVYVLCQKSLGNDSMKPSLLTRHLERAHPEFKDKELDFFKHRESVFKKQCLDNGGMFFQQTNASLKASVVRDASFLVNCAGSASDLRRICVGSASDLRRIWWGILTLALAKTTSSIPRQSDEVAMKHSLCRATKL